MHRSPPPRLAITMGDPAGIGPELALKIAADDAIGRDCLPIIFGDVSVLRTVASRLHLPLPETIVDHRHGLASLATLDRPSVLDFQNSLPDLHPGRFDRFTGQASFAYVTEAIDAAMSGHVSALVTGPIQKEAWHDAGIEFPGHTELLVQRTGCDRSCMMLTSDEISCALVTVHVGIGQVPALLSEQKILETIHLAHAALSARLKRPARVAVCGLNPHAGENGLFGDREEQRLIAPAIQAARQAGIDTIGPLSPDTAFVPAVRNEVDVFVCMYHDQGLIPLKALAFDDAVNVTLGLPIVRTSVDHGTAGNIAWQGKASERSMKRAVALALAMIDSAR